MRRSAPWRPHCEHGVTPERFRPLRAGEVFGRAAGLTRAAAPPPSRPDRDSIAARRVARRNQR